MLTTHYMEEADQLCERVAIIDHGQLLALDTPENLKATIGADTELRIRATGDLEALARELATMAGIDSTRVLDDTVFAYVQTRRAEAARDHRATPNERGFTITDVAVKETTLETVFIKLTGRELRE